jgi:hypothetical protein
MKGLATRTIVLIILGLLVLSLVSALIFLGSGPFKKGVDFNACRARLISYCNGLSNEFSSDCAGKKFGDFDVFCDDGASGCKINCDSDSSDDVITCCNVFGQG